MLEWGRRVFAIAVTGVEAWNGVGVASRIA